MSDLTREEAIQVLQTALTSPFIYGEYADAIDKAIEALSQPNYETDTEVRLAVTNRKKEKVILWDSFGSMEYVPSAEAEWIPFRDDLLIRENAAEVVGEFFNKMDISLFGRTGVRLARNVLNSVPTVAPLKWIPLNKDGHEPLFEGDYLLCLDDGYIASVYFDGSDWGLWADSGEPIAWMPLPKPYREDGEQE